MNESLNCTGQDTINSKPLATTAKGKSLVGLGFKRDIASEGHNISRLG